MSKGRNTEYFPLMSADKILVQESWMTS